MIKWFTPSVGPLGSQGVTHYRIGNPNVGCTVQIGSDVERVLGEDSGVGALHSSTGGSGRYRRLAADQLHQY